MSLILSQLPLAAALLAGDIPTAQRIATLTPLFAPPPGAELQLDPRELRDLGRRINARRLRGQIVVTPPKGQCLTVRRPGQDDDEICKRTQLSFVLDDLGRDGTLRWTVVTGPGDFGTELLWHSPYRVAVVTPFDKSLDDQPEYRYIASCKAEPDSPAGRRITLRLLSGETWVVLLPSEDELLPQPDPIANLLVSTSGGKVSIKDAQQRQDAEGGEKKEEGAKEGDKKESDKKEGEAEAEKAKAGPKIRDKDDRKDWAIPLRNAYRMSADHFLPNGAVPHGTHGECRYIFNGPLEDPDTGRIECHDADGFKAAMLPLTCLIQLKPKTAPADASDRKP